MGSLIMAQTALPAILPEDSIIVDGMAIKPTRIVFDERVETEEAPQWNLDNCSCVAYMRELGHDFETIPDPSKLPNNSSPVIGGLVLLKWNGLPHIGHIANFFPEGMWVKHRYLSKGNCITTEEFFSFTDERIVGFHL